MNNPDRVSRRNFVFRAGGLCALGGAGALLSVSSCSSTTPLDVTEGFSGTEILEEGSGFFVEEHPCESVWRTFNGFDVKYAQEDGEIVSKIYPGDGVDIYHLETAYVANFPESSRDFLSRFGFRKFPEKDRNVRVFRDSDLKSGEGFVRVFHYSPSFGRESILHSLAKDPIVFQYAEVYLPRDQTVRPGTDSSGGKYPSHQPMQEL
jgi:hypothetical protein